MDELRSRVDSLKQDLAPKAALIAELESKLAASDNKR